MKKVFVEPKIKKIELNLSENIAESKTTDGMMFYFWYHWTECTVQHSNKLLSQGVPNDELWLCFANETESTSLRGRMAVPEEIVRMNLKY